MLTTGSMTGLTLTALSICRPDGVELYTIEREEFGPGMVALTGPNGAGKSTLLKFIAGLNSASSGDVRACGVTKSESPAEFARLTAYQMQNFSGYPRLSGFEFLRYTLRLRGFSSKDASALAAQGLVSVGLEHAEVPIEAYSQGMLQRLGIAYVIKSSAPVALMDEPFAGVDPEGRHNLLDLIEEQSVDRTFLICTHHVDELLQRGARRLDVRPGGSEANAS